MARIQVTNLTFCYEGSFDNIFENVSFSIDTDWKLGFIGRNGKGKTTFLNLLLDKYEYSGSIHARMAFDYFPYSINKEQMEQCGAELLEQLKHGCEQWRVICELSELGMDTEVLYRPFYTLSLGERTKVMLALLFSGENDFLLIDEPTNHLDQESREIVKDYLKMKKGFILVSHDRDLLDACIDHVLVLNRCSVEVQKGNFSTWWENKERADSFSQMENDKHKREIAKLKKASTQTRKWADKNEDTKIGYDPVKEHDRNIGTRAYIGAKTKKMQSRVKQMENRIGQEIQKKEGLLKDIEKPAVLKLTPLYHYKNVLVEAKNYGFEYEGASSPVFEHLNMEIRQGERVFLHGKNGCGKSTFIKDILKHNVAGSTSGAKLCTITDQNEISGREQGSLITASGLVISYINQDTSWLKGNLRQFLRERELEESLFLAIVRQLDMDRVQFTKNLEDFSDGQKKKVLAAMSLMTPAHIYIWDEPLNYIDVFSRIQIEELILKYEPTMLIVEHDVRFRERIATKVVEM